MKLEPTPLIRLSNLFPGRQIYAKCEFVAPAGSFKIRGAVHLLEHLTRHSPLRQLVVPSMGNTALGVAVAAREYGFKMIGVVPDNIGRAKDEKLRALGVELVKLRCGGSDLIRHAAEIAPQRGAYFVHPHLDALWTDGYCSMAAEILEQLPGCASIVFPLGGGGLLMGLSHHIENERANVTMIGCEPYNFPTYAPYEHARTKTIADGLLLDVPHPLVQQRIAAKGIAVQLVPEPAIRQALADLYWQQALIIEPSSAITAAAVRAAGVEVPEPACLVFTGENIAREDFRSLVSVAG